MATRAATGAAVAMTSNRSWSATWRTCSSAVSLRPTPHRSCSTRRSRSSSPDLRPSQHARAWGFGPTPLRFPESWQALASRGHSSARTRTIGPKGCLEHLMEDQMTTRRNFLAGAAATAATAALGACSGSSTGSTATATAEDTSPVTLRFGWWGNDVRNKNTAQVIADYMKLHPNVTVTGEPGVWASYWDKLSTQVAGNSAPDTVSYTHLTLPTILRV